MGRPREGDSGAPMHVMVTSNACRSSVPGLGARCSRCDYDFRVVMGLSHQDCDGITILAMHLS